MERMEYLVKSSQESRVLERKHLEEIRKRLYANSKCEVRYCRIYRERILRVLNQQLNRSREEWIYPEEAVFYEKISPMCRDQITPEVLIAYCVFRVYYPIDDGVIYVTMNGSGNGDGPTNKVEGLVPYDFKESVVYIDTDALSFVMDGDYDIPEIPDDPSDTPDDTPDISGMDISFIENATAYFLGSNQPVFGQPCQRWQCHMKKLSRFLAAVKLRFFLHRGGKHPFRHPVDDNVNERVEDRHKHRHLHWI